MNGTSLQSVTTLFKAILDVLVWFILINFLDPVNTVQLYTVLFLPEAVYIVAIDLLIFDLCLCPLRVEEVAGTYPVYSLHRRSSLSVSISLSLSICISHSKGMSHQQKHACSYETTATRQTTTLCVFTSTRQKKKSLSSNRITELNRKSSRTQRFAWPKGVSV